MGPTSLQDSSGSLPPIAALFLVVFDRKVGYTIAWKRSIPDVDLDAVEYKSLPSGLHNVQSDLIYFVHGDHAGLSAFVNQPAEESQRNAHFAAVGVLVPLTLGRLGRSWLHAEELRRLAQRTVHDTNDISVLEDYWTAHRSDEHGERTKVLAEPSSPTEGRQASSNQPQKRKNRALSDAVGFSGSDHVLSLEHPALSLPALLSMFGPLLFPLHRAALLRKRILLVGSAPVKQSCNFVYGISILSNIPPSLLDAVPTAESLSRIRPLFNVGIHDIPVLQEQADGGKDADHRQTGWVACTTDDILATKVQLSDIVVELPSTNSVDTSSKVWPRIRTSSGHTIKATQRDLRKYTSLRKELLRLQQRRQAESRYTDAEDDDTIHDQDDESRPLVQPPPAEESEEGDYSPLENESSIVEPSSWAAIAYSSFLWWASAGERDALLADEANQDSVLLDELSNAISPYSYSRLAKRRSSNAHEQGEGLENAQEVATLLIAYFHRLTALMLETIEDVVSFDGDAESEADQGKVVVENHDLARMGLDVWSEADKSFVRETVALYFGREAEVKGRSVECCGVKIC